MSIDVPQENDSIVAVPSDVEAAFAEVVARREERIEAETAHNTAAKSLWLAHHWPHRYERCATIAGRHVCRRCLWFYSISLAIVALAFAGISPWPASLDVVMVWVLSIPATVEFIGGEFGKWEYSPRRQVAVTGVLAIAVGRGFYRNIEDQFTWIFWGPAIVFGLLWFVTGLYTWSQNKGQYRESAEPGEA